MLLALVVFAGVFLAVCLIAYLILLKPDDDLKGPPPRRARATRQQIGYGPPPAAGVEDRTRKPDAYRPAGGARTRPGALSLIAALAATFGVVLSVIYGVVAAIDHVGSWFVLFRGVPAVPLGLQWAIPYVLAAAVLVIALPLARRFRRPERFRTGAVLLAIAFATFWPLQYLAASFDQPFWEYEAILHGLAFFISICLLSGGLETMRRASNTPRDDSWEFWRET